MSAGVTLTVIWNLKPEFVESTIAKLPELLEQVRDFEGLRSLRILRHKTDPNKLIFLHDWDSEAQYDVYVAWRMKQGIVGGLMDNSTSPIQIDIWSSVIASC